MSLEVVSSLPHPTTFPIANRRGAVGYPAAKMRAISERPTDRLVIRAKTERKKPTTIAGEFILNELYLTGLHDRKWVQEFMRQRGTNDLVLASLIAGCALRGAGMKGRFGFPADIQRDTANNCEITSAGCIGIPLHQSIAWGVPDDLEHRGIEAIDKNQITSLEHLGPQDIRIGPGKGVLFERSNPADLTHEYIEWDETAERVPVNLTYVKGVRGLDFVPDEYTLYIVDARVELAAKRCPQVSKEVSQRLVHMDETQRPETNGKQIPHCLSVAAFSIEVVRQNIVGADFC